MANGKETADISRIREPIVEGIFYPASKVDLERQIDELLARSPVTEGGAAAVISPHAAYLYAGAHIANAFAAAAGREIRTIILLAPVHRDPEDALILPESEYFQTPLGAAQVDRELAEKLEEHSTRMLCNDIPHLEEHAIEVQIPFVQRLFPGAQVLPILLGRPNKTNIRVLARSIEAATSGSYDDVLFVATSNLATDRESESCRAEAQLALSLVQSRSSDELLDAYRQGRVTACGSGCISALFHILHKPLEVNVLSTSLDSEPDPDAERKTHYGSFALRT